MALIRFIDMFAFSHGGNRNQQEGYVCHFDVDSGSFIIMRYRHFDVVERYSDVGFQHFLKRRYDIIEL